MPRDRDIRRVQRDHALKNLCADFPCLIPWVRERQTSTAMGSEFSQRALQLLRCVGWLLVIGSAAIGLLARFKGLGTWSFSGDEYHTAQSIRNILATGAPRFECGGYYIRGIALQYLSAALLYLGHFQEEWALRTLNAGLSLLAAPPLFLLARRVGGAKVALAVLALFFMSLWEIEYARFARMYGPFQAIFVWYVYFLYRVVVDSDWTSYRWLFALSVASLLVYEGGALLVLANFIPFSANSDAFRWRYLAISVVLVAIAYSFVSFDFRHWGAAEVISGEQAVARQDGEAFAWPESLGPLVVPKLFIVFLIGDPTWGTLGVLCLAACLWVGYRLVTDGVLSYQSRVAYIAMLTLCVLNLFGMAVCLGLVFWMLRWVRFSDLHFKAVRWAGAVGAGCFLFWLSFGLLTTRWYVLFDGDVENPLWKTGVVLLKYPDVYLKIIHEWWIVQPITTMVLGGFAALGVFGAARTERGGDGVRLLAAVVVIFGLLVAALRQPYYASRYTFFLYPIVLLLGTVGLHRAAVCIFRTPHVQGPVFVVAACTLVLVAEDFNIHHALNVDSKNINFRKGYLEEQKYHLWYRKDFRSPAQFINDRLTPGATVITTLLPIDYYMERVDFVYRSRENPEYQNVVACGGEREIWTNARLISREEQLFDLVDGRHDTVWVVTDSAAYSSQSPIERRLSTEFVESLVYVGAGGYVNVYRFD